LKRLDLLAMTSGEIGLGEVRGRKSRFGSGSGGGWWEENRWESEGG